MMAMVAGTLAAGTLLADVAPEKEAFRNPPCEFSPAYFWMWNAKLDKTIIERQLNDMAANGMKSVCIHPFPREFAPGAFNTEMEPDYLTDGYVELFEHAIRYAAKLGMNAWLYDEGGWPSGGACGLVAKSDPEGRFCKRFLGWGPKGDEPFGIHPQPYAAHGRNTPSVIEKGTTERFIELTHERYAKAFGDEFGKSVKFTFMDEPQMPSDHYGLQIGWAADFAEVFKERKGYDIMPYMPELIRRKHDILPDELNAKRIDFYEVKAYLFRERFMKPIQDWCHAHGLRSSGHLNGEDLPECSSRYGHGCTLAAFRMMDVPGVDVIWRQLYPSTDANPGAQSPFPRYASSVAHQLGEPYVLSESAGIYGNSVTPDEWRWLCEYQMVRGVNMFVFGYYAMSNAKQWMMLFEPHSGPVNPGWDFMRPFFDHLARVSALMAQGRAATDIAVFYDNRAFWADHAVAEAAANAHYAVAKTLDRMNCDYDFVEDDALAAAEVRDGRIVVGKMAYASLVLPSSKWMSEGAKAKLAAFAQAGGRVVKPEEVPSIPRTMRIDGRMAPELRVAKRMIGGKTLYYVVNESRWEVSVSLNFDGRGDVVRCDPETGRFVATGVQGGGSCPWTFAPFDSALFLVGGQADDPVPAAYAGATIEPKDGWTVRKTVSHVVGKTDWEFHENADAAVPTVLGDWREKMGYDFSGKAVYRVEFESVAGGEAELDLGRVCWSCGVRLNGKEVGKKFFGPYRFAVTLAKGRNVLEVTVANLLANAVGSDVVRDRIGRDFPPVAGYDKRMRNYDREHNESGLFGPVTVTERK